jgi:DNA-binding CsgD family transcriptional regulator
VTIDSAVRPRAVLDATPLDDTRRGLLDLVAADPYAPVSMGLAAPGGYGKSVLLGALAKRYREAGVPVVGLGEPGADADGGAVLVDDAHRLGEDGVRELLRLARLPSARLAVAYRPWPRTAALAELASALHQRGPLVSLPPFGPEQVRDVLAANGLPPEPRLVELVAAQTAGVPALVDRLAGALRGRPVDEVRGRPADEVPGRPAAGEVPDAALGWLRHDLDVLPPDVLLFLLAAEAGAGRDLDLLGRLLRRDTDRVGETVEAARATGLVGRDGVPVPVVRRAIAAVVPAERRVTVRCRLAELQLDRGGPVLGLARSLLGTGVTGPGVAAAFEAAGDEALAREPALAAALYAAGVAAGAGATAGATAGRPGAPVAIRWAQAAALAGDLDTALRLADQVLAADGAPGRTDATRADATRTDAARVAAAALAHRGQLAHSTELYGWSGPGWPAAFAAIGHIGTGDLAGGQRLLDEATAAGPPTLFAGAATLAAHGVRESVTGGTTGALAALVRAADLLAPAGRAALLPDSPAALAALVALHAGELELAGSVLDRALAAATGGTLLGVRHRLLRAWTRMVRGETVAARQLLAGTAAREPRDWLFRVGLELGLARRESDLGALHRTWADACEAVLRHPVDLFVLLPLGELAICAARLGDHGRMAPHLAEAGTLLERLGNPPLWTAPLRWSRLHAAIIAEQPAQAAEQAAALADVARHGGPYPALAAAAECWLAVLAGAVDQDRVEAAARGLYGVGLPWDGARLAAQAAIRTPDRKAMLALMDCARVLQGKPATGRQPAPAVPVAAQADAARLSEREREVAALVVAGLTYKQIGDRLFISPKTIEHHVARMRHRLGCESRSDLLARLRDLVSGVG